MTPKQKYRASPKGQATEAAYRLRYNKRKRIRYINDPDYKARSLTAGKTGYIINRELRLRYVFLKKYGITWEERDALLVLQGGCCKICGNADHGAKSRGWHMDHDPRKKKGDPGFIRGVLCLKCNIGLGMFNEGPELLLRAADYLDDPNR